MSPQIDLILSVKHILIELVFRQSELYIFFNPLMKQLLTWGLPRLG